jgi:predicted esterase
LSEPLHEKLNLAAFKISNQKPEIIKLLMLVNKLETKKTARYFQSAPITSQTKKVWIVLHGYGMHAGMFLKKFEPLFSNEIVFVAPEALNRYYVKGSSGHVGASWMTREERLDEIDDYVNYLEKVVNKLALNSEMELTVLGFSQGASTLARWVSKSSSIPAKAVFYAGVFPPDLEIHFNEKPWTGLPVFVFIGKSDEFYAPSEFNATFEPLIKVNSTVKFTVFEGKHEILPTVLRNYL